MSVCLRGGGGGGHVQSGHIIPALNVWAAGT